MMQSSFDQETSRRLHVAIVMDGNGRWAEARGLPRLAGHRRGVRAARRIVEAAPGLGIGTLTLFAFSSDNWKRPRPEVDGLMALLGSYLRREAAALATHDVRLSLIGRRDRLALPLRAAVPADLAAALDDFHERDRRFGALPLAVSTPSTRSR